MTAKHYTQADVNWHVKTALAQQRREQAAQAEAATEEAAPEPEQPEGEADADLADAQAEAEAATRRAEVVMEGARFGIPEGKLRYLAALVPADAEDIRAAVREVVADYPEFAAGAAPLTPLERAIRERAKAI